MKQKFVKSPELRAIALRYLEAYGANDYEAVLNFYADDPAVRYIGSAEDEFWDGATLTALLNGPQSIKPEYKTIDLQLEAFERDGTGLVTFKGYFEFSTGKSTWVRGTHVYVLDRGAWRLVHAHHSSPLPNIENMGYEIAGVEELLADAGSTTDLGQSGIASVMFTDIADSTTLAEMLGDTGWNRILSGHLDALRKIIEASGGRLVKTLGDGTMSSFPTATSALKAAQAIQLDNERRGGEPYLQLRIGLHTGDVVETGGDYVGGVVNKAARVAAIASPGDIRVSDATRAMVGNAREFRFDAGIKTPLRGLEGDHLVYRLEWQA